ncbi:MAG TPA: DUF3147 family protein [Chloroflexota bacterium]|jgi:predicted permease|nr:DUF3147 family protein [Chloroflexota bacterium]
MSGPLGIAVDPGEMKRAKPKEYALRFAFGGTITLLTGLIAHFYGPLVGGLFLAFPAILPASVTLLQKHEDHKQAGIDALGAAVGSIGLLPFGLVIWLLAQRFPAWLVIALATALWFISSALLWMIAKGFQQRRPGVLHSQDQ